jgi:hypothetical protein
MMGLNKKFWEELKPLIFFEYFNLCGEANNEYPPITNYVLQVLS